jgi:hypothetical protein
MMMPTDPKGQRRPADDHATDFVPPPRPNTGMKNKTILFLIVFRVHCDLNVALAVANAFR